MSRLFDALQRSEAERSGADLSALSTATEVLQQTELHAASSSEREVVQLKQPRGIDTLKDNTSFGRRFDQSDIATDNIPEFDDFPASERYLEEFSQFPTIKVSIAAQSRLVCFTDSESLVAEKFRFLGVRLQNMRRERSLKKLLITSTIPQEGKSTVAANLA
jgi:Mrp family chromosome partitioning ATPase